jgi:hypothetical protein
MYFGWKEMAKLKNAEVMIILSYLWLSYANRTECRLIKTLEVDKYKISVHFFLKGRVRRKEHFCSIYCDVCSNCTQNSDIKLSEI